MITLVLAMLVCLLLGLAVVLAVAVPARREGRDFLTPKGEEVVARVKERTETVATATRERTTDFVSATKDRTSSVRHRGTGTGTGTGTAEGTANVEAAPPPEEQPDSRTPSLGQPLTGANG